MSANQVRGLACMVLGDGARLKMTRRLRDGHWCARAHDGQVLRLRTTIQVVRKKRQEALLDLHGLLERIRPI